MNRIFGPLTIDEATSLVEKMLDDCSLRETLISYLTHSITKEQFGYEVDIIAENNEDYMRKPGEPWV